MPPSIANGLSPPYYAVVFTSQRRSDPNDGYPDMSQQMVELVQQQPGFLGFETARDPEGLGITVSYWSSLEAIRSWRNVEQHRQAQLQGKSRWYESYRLRICLVESEYGFPLET